MNDRPRLREAEPQPEDLAAFLALAEHHIRHIAVSESAQSVGTYYAPRLLAAVQKVLAQHQPGRIVILGALCPRHENHRHFSITAAEAEGITACQECPATVYDSCAGCGPQVRLDSCPARMAISGELLSKGE